MELTIEIPDDIAEQMIAAGGGDLSRRVLESVAVRAYLEKRISKTNVARLLGFETVDQASAFLKDRGLE